jgi:hypothetical protein
VSGRLTDKQALRRDEVEAALDQIVGDYIVRWNASLDDR